MTARSVRLIEEGLARFHALGDEAGIAVALLNLGATVGNQGDLTRAVAVLAEALARSEALGDLRHIAIAQALLGAVLLEQGDLDAATRTLVEGLAGHVERADWWFVAYTLTMLVRVQMARRRWEVAAHLLGAAEAIGAGVSSKIGDQSYEEMRAAIREHLDAARFAAAWEAGHALRLAEAVAAALAIVTDAAPAPEAPPPPPPDTVPLTRREREIARLLAQGRSDREIAAALFLSAGTVSGHVHHILQKLELSSRHQVAHWLHEREPEVADPD